MLAMTDLLALIVVAMLDPVWIIVVLLLLRTERGLIKAAAFSIGALMVRVLQGLLFGDVFAEAARAGGDESPSIIASTLLLVVGIFLLIVAVKKWRKEPDPDAPPPKWIASLQTISIFKAFGMGALLMATAIKQWFFTLSAIAVIDEAQWGQLSSVLAFTLFVVCVHAPGLVPIVLSRVAPIQLSTSLTAFGGWVDRNNRAISVSASFAFGVFFLWKGMTGLPG
jgi:hypothetical protein